MPLVFVHGVANRKTPQSEAEARQRGALFRQLVLPEGSRVFDPDWGSDAVSFDPNLPWLPKAGGETWGSRPAAAGRAPENPAADSPAIRELISDDPLLAIDLAFEAALLARAAKAAEADRPAEAIDDEMVSAFAKAVDYISDQDRYDAAAFADVTSSDALVQALAGEMALGAGGPCAPEGMGVVSDSIAWLRKGLGIVAGAARNAAETPLLRLGRPPLSRAVALFLGDIFVYLQQRAASGSGNRIFAAIAADLAEAAKLSSARDPLIIIGHSLGGVILYDLLSDPAAVRQIETTAGKALDVAALITVGSQPSLFADMGLYQNVARGGEGRFPRPACVRAWLNVYDETDVLSFACVPLFDGVEDFEYDNVTGLLEAHTAYFRRPRFYQRLRARLAEAT